ncbi:Bax inhibitor-1/YccA family membrane protein [Kitasatospora indigofera]|uniref:Bax inhibitor-1/YccA family membrane protein n=1 Tax=Kitasatospora indigofera TaxID=67307 RepID=UPI00368BC946
MTDVERRTLKSSNPVLSRHGVTRRTGEKTVARGLLLQPAVGADRDGFADPWASRPLLGLPPLTTGQLLTFDAVVGRAAAALAVAAVAAGAAWRWQPADARSGYALAGLLGAVAVLLTVARRRGRTPAPGLTFAFAAFEGAFLGLLSGAVARQTSSGAAVQVVLGTMAASAGVLIAYRLRLIRMTRRFRGYAAAAVLGGVLLAGTDGLVARVAGPGGLGFHSGEGWAIGALCALAGILLATPAISIHVRRIEEMITQGVPARACWTAAFGLTLTLVWLYVEAARGLTLVPEEDLQVY